MGNSLLAWTNVCKTAALTATSAEVALPVTNLSTDQGSAASAWQSLAGALAPTVTITPAAATTMRAVGVFRTNLTSSASVLVEAFGAPLDTTLDLNFVDGSAIDSRIVFTRASSATYFDAAGVMQTATTNTARFDYDPVTHAAKGLLIEEARTNLIIQSVPPTSWGAFAATFTASAGTAPDGGNNAVRVAETATTVTHYVYATPTVASGSVYTFSIYAKAAQNRYLQLGYDDNSTGAGGSYATFDLQTGTVTQGPTAFGAGVATSAAITPASNGFYRCSLTGSISVTTGRLVAVLALTGSPGQYPSYAGNASNGVLVWGAQHELGAFPTSYIPTSGTAATRAADAANMPIGAWFSANAGSLAFEWDTASSVAMTAGGFAKTADFNNSFYINGAGTTMLVGGVGASVFGSALQSPGSINKQVASYTSGLMSIVNNGGAAGSVAVGAAPFPFINNLGIGGTPWAAGSAIGGHMRRIRYWPRALTTAEMQRATSALFSATLSPVNGQVVAVFPADVSATYVTITFSDPTNPDNHINVPLAFAGPAWQPLTAMAWSSSMGRDAISDTVQTRGGQTYVDLRASARRWEIALDGVRDTEAFTQLDVLARACLAGGNVLVCPNITSANLQYEATFGVLKPTADVTFPLGIGARRSWRASLSERL